MMKKIYNLYFLAINDNFQHYLCKTEVKKGYWMVLLIILNAKKNQS